MPFTITRETVTLDRLRELGYITPAHENLWRRDRANPPAIIYAGPPSDCPTIKPAYRASVPAAGVQFQY